jgi:hypothetical protein
MNSKRLLSLLLLFSSVLLLASCSGHHDGGCTTNCPSTNATVSITLFDTPPTGLNLLSFTLPIAGISLSPKSGSPVVLPPTVGSVEATRLQTDSALIVDAATVAPGTYTLNVTLGPTMATTNAFVNATGNPITYSLNGVSFTCVKLAVCYLPAGAVATITPTNTFTLSGNQKVWIGLNLNLSNAITTSGGLSVDFTQSNVLTATTTTRVGLPSGAVDTIEDFVGVVTAYTAGSTITVQNGLSGQKLTATLNSSTEYDTPPNGSAYTGCSATAQTCLKVGSTVSMDSNLDSSGNLTATEVDLLDTTAVDEIEGIIYPTATTNVYGVILADKVSVSGNAVLSAQTTSWGTGIFVTAGTTNNVFAIDTKTLTNQLTNPSGLGFSGIGDILAGQQVRLQPQNVTTATSNGTTIITATAHNVLLRYSRFTGAPSNVGTSGFTFTPPAYVSALNSILPTAPIALTFTNTAYDGVANTPSIANTSVAAIRTLYLNNSQLTFAVAKVRVP